MRGSHKNRMLYSASGKLLFKLTMHNGTNQSTPNKEPQNYNYMLAALMARCRRKRSAGLAVGISKALAIACETTASG